MHIRNFLINNTKEKKNFEYIPEYLETNILNSVCSDDNVKIEIAKAIVLSVKKRDSQYLSTDFHVKWVMECIGYSFLLPIEYSITISQAISIYKTWISSPSKRPECISANESFYQRQILGHMSLIFTERPWETIHADLCAQVLKLYRMLIRRAVIFKENYHYLMQLCILSFSPILCKNTEFAKKIGGEMSRTIFEIWLRCETREKNLWKEVCKGFSRWVIHTDVIETWRNVAFGLSQRIVNFLYGEGTDKLFIIFKEEGTISFDTSFEHIVLAWNYLVNVILDSTGASIFDPITHSDIVKSVTAIVDVFVEIAHKRTLPRVFDIQFHTVQGSESIQNLSLECQSIHTRYQKGLNSLPIPSIPSLMNIFGNWLLAQSNNKGSHTTGQAEAIGCLCKIFYKGAGPVPDSYLANFYRAISKGFKFATEANFEVAGSILKHSVKLLIQDHKGIRILLHRSFAFKVIGLYISSKEVPQVVKKPCYSILSTVITTLKLYYPLGIANTANEALATGISTETEADSIINLCWAVCSYMSILEDSKLIEKFVKTITAKVLLMDNNDKKLYTECLNVISLIPFMILHNKLISEGGVKELIYKFLLTISKKSSRSPNEYLCVSFFNMLMNWIFKFPQVLADFSLKSQLFEVLSGVKSLTGMKEYISYVENYLLNNIGKNFPVYNFGYNNSFILTHSFFTNGFSHKYQHFLFKNDVLASFCNTKTESIAIVRNQMGRYIWKLYPAYGNPKTTKKNIKIQLKVIEPRKNFQKNKKEQEKEIKRKTKKTFKDLSHGMSELELEYLTKLTRIFKKTEKNQMLSETNIIHRNYPLKPVPINKENYYRVFLSELGYFSQELLPDISYVDSNDCAAELDEINDKKTFKVPIFYVEKPEALESELCLTYSEYPAAYKELLDQMGVYLDPSHKRYDAFKSVSSLIDKYGGVILNREYYYEVVSLVPALFESNHRFSVDDLLQYSQLAVLWNQRFLEPSSLRQPLILENPKFKKKTVIMLTPLRNNIIKVNVIGRETNCGPLINNTLIPLPLIGKFVCKGIANFDSNASSRITLRQMRIETFNHYKDLNKPSEASNYAKIASVAMQTFFDKE